jgi:hypothetical protein
MENLPLYDQELDNLLDRVIFRVQQLMKEDGNNLHYRNLLRVVNCTSSILARQKYAKKERKRADSPMDWETTH